VALSACGSGDGSGGGGEIQLPSFESGNEGEGAAMNNTLLYVLIGAIVLVAVVALAGRK